MPGVSLSRWTMSYFAAALVSLVVAEGLMASGFGYPAAPVEAPETLVVVHLVAIGWLSLLMLGALFQFVPVLVAKPIHSNALPLPTLVGLLAGLAVLLLGFLRLAGIVLWNLPLFAVASLLLGAALTLAMWNLGRTLWSAARLELPALFVVVGLASLAATAALGIVFALVFGGHASASHLLDLVGLGRSVHAVAGLGGWLTFTAMGISYRLLAMFMLAPEVDGTGSRIVFSAGTAALAIAVVGGIGAICRGAGAEPALAVAGIIGLVALVLYANDVVRLIRERKRRTLELNSRMATLALVSLGLASVLIVVLATLGRLPDDAGAVVFLVAFGWLSGLGLAKLYKIVAFLTWLECFGPVLGKVPTPRVQDLVDEPRATKWFLLYFLAVWSASAALLAGNPLVFRAATAGMAVATAGIVAHLVRTRRLARIGKTDGLPAGAFRPRLLFCHAR